MSSRYAIPALLLGACTTTEPLVVEHRSVLEVPTLGMSLDQTGNRGHAGMYGTTCEFFTRQGNVDADYDFEGNHDTVTDGTDGEGGYETVVITPGGAHVVRPGRTAILDLAEGWPHQAVFTEGDVVVIHGEDPELPDGDDGGCSAGFVHRGEVDPWVEVALPASACDRDVVVSSDRRDAVYVATPDGLLVVDAEGWSPLDVDGDLVAYDPSVDGMYVARKGSSTIGAYDPDGTPRWEVEVDGKVRAMTHLGDDASVVITASRDDAGALIFLDGTTGDVRADARTPSVARGVVASGNGEVVGLVLKEQTHFYDTRPLRAR